MDDIEAVFERLERTTEAPRRSRRVRRTEIPGEPASPTSAPRASLAAVVVGHSSLVVTGGDPAPEVTVEPVPPVQVAEPAAATPSVAEPAAPEPVTVPAPVARTRAPLARLAAWGGAGAVLALVIRVLRRCGR